MTSCDSHTSEIQALLGLAYPDRTEAERREVEEKLACVLVVLFGMTTRIDAPAPGTTVYLD